MRWLAPWRELSQLPRPIWLLSASVLVNRMGSMALPFLALYLTRGLGFPISMSGRFLAIYGGTALAANLIAGWLSDRYGGVRVVLWSLGLSGIAMGVYPFFHSLACLVVMTVLWSLSVEMYRPACFFLVAEMAPPDHRKAAFALLRLAVNLGMSVGPALGGFLAHFSFGWLFWIDGGTALLAFVLLWWWLPGDTAHTPHAPGSPRRFLGSLSDSGFRFFLLALLPVSMVFFQLESTFPLHLVHNLHYTEASFGVLFTVNTVVIILLEIPLNHATARWPHGRTMGIGSLLVTAGFGSLLLFHSWTGIVASVLLWTFGEMVLFPGMSAYVASIAPEGLRGDYMGFYTLVFSLGFALGPWAGTQILEKWGDSWVWIGCWMAGLLSTVLLTRVRATPPLAET